MLVNIDGIVTMPEPAAWIHQQRKAFDEQSYALLIYNQTQDEGLLTSYRQWVDDYLLQRIDANVYATLIVILRHQRANAQGNARLREAAFFFPQDPRFS